jgi:hypothetical protein
MAMEQPIRARVPEHVSNGAFSTGVIVMTANSEFILDFVQNLGRPHQITARVVMPHYVLPQLVDALQRNIELYRSRWGELPQAGKASPTQLPWSSSSGSTSNPQQQPSGESASGVQSGGQPSFGDSQNSASGAAEATDGPSEFSQPDAGGAAPPQDMGTSQQDVGVRHPTAQDIYDDLKIRDELLSGAYANAVMIGHGAHEFSFDFITNFYPHSSVSARVFMAAGQVPRFYESLKGTWEQLKARNQSRGGNPGSPGAGGNEPSGDDPDAPPPDNPFA